MKIRTLAIAVGVGLSLSLATTPVHAERLGNYFICKLADGKTPADLVAFKDEYEKAVAEAGLTGYELRVQLPIYWDKREQGSFVWDGSWDGYEQMAKISAWFLASEWPTRFQEMMDCAGSSLWRIVD